MKRSRKIGDANQDEISAHYRFSKCNMHAHTGFRVTANVAIDSKTR